MGYSEQMLEVFPHSWTFDNGYMHPGDKPGLGIEFDENSRLNIRMSQPIYPLRALKMARCGIGN